MQLNFAVWFKHGAIGLAMFCIFGLTIAGCKVGPNYHRQQTEMPAEWTGAIAEPNQTIKYVELADWWAAFDDPNLTSLITRAIK